MGAVVKACLRALKVCRQSLEKTQGASFRVSQCHAPNMFGTVDMEKVS